MFKIAATTFVLMLVLYATGQENAPHFEGELPPGVPEGAVLSAMVVDDMAAFSTVPLGTVEVADGSWQLRLPAELPVEQLQELQVCGGGNISVALVTHFEVVAGDATVGQLWRTNEAPGAWGMYGPSEYTYFAYVSEPVVLEDDCWGDVTELNLQPGWNLYTRLLTDTGSLVTSAEPPDDFVWHYLD